MDLTGKKILITGGSSGIGRAAALLLARQGARVILQARGLEKLQAVAEEIKSEGGQVHIYSVDLTDLRAVGAAAEKVINEVGLPDIIINNAGAGRWLFIDETPSPEAEQMMAAPYFAAFHTTRAFIEPMLTRNSGHIININSAACFLYFPGAIGYISSRWALRGFSESLRADLYNTKIAVSMIAPGKVSSEYFGNNPGSEERIPAIAKLYPTLTTEYVAKVILKTIRNRRKTVVPPRLLGFTVWLNRFIPGAVGLLMRVTGVQRK